MLKRAVTSLLHMRLAHQGLAVPRLYTQALRLSYSTLEILESTARLMQVHCLTVDGVAFRALRPLQSTVLDGSAVVVSKRILRLTCATFP